ncbi:nuclease-related domain-containing DEAD/DEAH box helicase [Pseudomonas sp. 91RF]|jgi:nucleoside-triphosphatase THEP1|uniref:nuclease-related domain-containing DEAD/DEAH box helicase n=1 Tax=Pseudomonas sp. 91RF TaxID=2292261 RepID=UPI0013140B3D|nr:AAA family ATPase [Pseudomonas sp. 91RF]
MAIMHPPHGPKFNDSHVAEPIVYRLLEEQLNDDFQIIHSIPWLSSFVDELQNNKSPVGEIDFLILHPDLGILALEVKGGVIGHNSSGFYYSKTNVDPVAQLNRGIFAIQEWLRNNGVTVQIGRAYFFPGSEMNTSQLPPSVVDNNHLLPIKLILDIKDLDRVDERVRSIMNYFKLLLNTVPISKSKIETIIEMLIPTISYTPCWYSKISSDNKLWLRLTPEQQECIDWALKKDRFLISGWPGTGKTIIAIETARRLSTSGTSVLCITFNSLLAQKISSELLDHANTLAITIYSLCSKASTYNGEKANFTADWFEKQAATSLKKACNNGFLNKYSALIIDEGQVIRRELWEILVEHFSSKKIIAMCDATQAFPYEKPVSLAQIEEYLQAQAFFLTESLRMPKRVCERLKIFQQPTHSITNLRQNDEDTLTEIITSNPKNTLSQTIAQILSQGLLPGQIIVLTPTYMGIPESLVPQGIKVESIGRFRGMESPVIIILAATDMSNLEFFCAYSRSTSRCIVILDAYEVQKGKYENLGRELYLNNKDHVDSESSKSLTQTIIKNQPTIDITLQNDIFHISWSKTWHAYTLPVQKCEVTRLLLEAFFIHSDTPKIYTWAPDSRSTISMIDKAENTYPLTLELKHCHICLEPTPHNVGNPPAGTCNVCTNPHNERNPNFENYILQLLSILTNRKMHSTEAIENLPIQIYSIGTLLKSRYNTTQSELISAFSQLSLEGRVAMALAIRELTIGYNKNRTEFKIGEISKNTYNWNKKLEIFSFPQWQGFINDAFAKLENNGLITKGAKGIRIIKREKFMIKANQE